jgi:translation elongation factor P/translation initiation factor 5A
MKSYDFLYSDGANYMFMSQESYEQVELSKETLG